MLASLCAVLPACGDRAETASDQAASDRAAGSGAAPPEVLAVSGEPDGAVTVEGRAVAEARVRAVTADGRAYGATARRDGLFSLSMPRIVPPQLVTVSAEGADAGPVEADGRLFVPPDQPGRAVLLHPGAPARPVGPRAGLIAAADYDAAGAAAVSGVTRPGAVVAVSVATGSPVQARADRQGVYGIRLGRDMRLRPGRHVVRVATAGREEARTLFLFPPAPAGAFSAVREPEAWRVSWAPEGGGAQTTVILMEAVAP